MIVVTQRNLEFFSDWIVLEQKWTHEDLFVEGVSF